MNPVAYSVGEHSLYGKRGCRPEQNVTICYASLQEPVEWSKETEDGKEEVGGFHGESGKYGFLLSTVPGQEVSRYQHSPRSSRSTSTLLPHLPKILLDITDHNTTAANNNTCAGSYNTTNILNLDATIYFDLHMRITIPI